MKSFFLSVLLIIGYTLIGFSQNAIGVHFDADGNPLLGSYHTLAYAPSNELIAHIKNPTYQEGSFALKNQPAQEAKLKITNGKLYQHYIREETEYKEEKTKYKEIKVKNLKWAKLGVDSCFVISGYKCITYVRQQEEILLKKGTKLALWKGTINNVEFAAIPKNSFDNSSSLFLVRRPGIQGWIKVDISTEKRFNKFVNTYFSDIPTPSQTLFFSTFSNSKFDLFFQKLQIYYSLKDKQAMHFNSNLQWERNPAKIVYSGYCTGFEENSLTFDFEKEGKITHRITFSGLMELQKEGWIINYYSNGEKRQECLIKNKVIDQITYYDPTGKVIHKYFQTVYKPYANLITYTNRFEKLNATEIPEGSVSITDTINQRKLYQEFENNKLVSSYYLEDDTKIYQVTAPEFNIKLENLQDKFIRDSRERNYSTSIQNNDYGYSLVLFKVNKKGKVISTQHLHSTSIGHQRVIEDVMTTSEVVDFKLGKYFVNGKSVPYEVVIPVNFKQVRSIPPTSDQYRYTPMGPGFPGSPNSTYSPPAFVVPR